MAEFIEAPTDIDDNPAPKVFTNEFITNVVKQSLENGDLPLDHKLALVGIVDERGARAILSVQVLNVSILDNKASLNIKIQSVVEHDWTGDNKAGAKLLFSLK